MTQHLLHNTQVCPMVEQVCCTRMTQSVGRNIAVYLCSQSGFSHNVEDHLAAYTGAAVGEKYCLGVVSAPPLSWF
jgi:hypothetical protein